MNWTCLRPVHFTSNRNQIATNDAICFSSVLFIIGLSIPALRHDITFVHNLTHITICLQETALQLQLFVIVWAGHHHPFALPIISNMWMNANSTVRRSAIHLWRFEFVALALPKMLINHDNFAAIGNEENFVDFSFRKTFVHNQNAHDCYDGISHSEGIAIKKNRLPSVDFFYSRVGRNCWVFSVLVHSLRKESKNMNQHDSRLAFYSTNQIIDTFEGRTVKSWFLSCVERWYHARVSHSWRVRRVILDVICVLDVTRYE